MLGDEQLILHLALLLGANRDDLRLRRDDRAHLLRVLTCRVHVVARGLHSGRDSLVLRGNRLEVVQRVDRFLDGARVENDFGDRRVRGFVQLDDPSVELAHRGRVLMLEEVQPLRLEAEQVVQPREALLVELEVVLEDREPLGHVADLTFERPDLRRDVGDLRVQRGFALVRSGGLFVQALDLLRVVTRRRRDEHQGHSERGEQGRASDHPVKVRQSVGRPCPLGPAPG